jgi:hypothetical protein
MRGKEPRLHVDFNEMLEPDLVLLSKEDTKVDTHGNVVFLREGLHVRIYDDDSDANGKVDNLIAEGVVERNVATGWSAVAKWCCRIDSTGIRHESDC